MRNLFRLALLTGGLAVTSAFSSVGMAAGLPGFAAAGAASASQASSTTLNGTYVFLTRGFVGGANASSAGTFVADGLGNITGGTLDTNSGIGPITSVPFTGHYAGTSSGLLLSITVFGGTVSIPVYPGLLNASGVATELRTVIGGSSAASSGVFYLQDPSIATESGPPAGSFVFGLAGASGSGRITTIGRFDESASTISNGELDIFNGSGGGVQALSAVPFSGSLAIALPSRQVSATFTSGAVTAHYNIYPVTNDQVLMLQTDATAGSFPPEAGSAIRQIASSTIVAPQVRLPLTRRYTPAAYGFTNLSVASKSVFSLSGLVGNSGAVSSVGLVSFNGSGSAALSSIQQLAGTISTSSLSSIPYAIADNGRMVVGPSASPALIAYVTDAGRGFLASTDGSLSFGTIEPQTAASLSTQTLDAGSYLFGSIAPETAQATQDAGLTTLDGNGNITAVAATDSGTGALGASNSSLSTYSIDSTGLLTTGFGATGYVVSPTRFVALIPGASHVVPLVFDQATSGSTVPVKTGTSTSLNTTTPSVMSGTSVTLTATVAPSAATGTVKFYDGSSPIGTGSLAGGTATLATSSLGVGTHSLTAVYGGDSNYAGSSSSPLSVTITPPDNSQVAPTGNPQVAAYSLTLQLPGTVTVYFGKTNTYGLETSAQHFAAGVPAVIYVAGMLQATTYHMRAVISYDNGSSAADPDHTFTTGTLAAGLLANLTVTTTNGLTPQPGIELIDLLQGSTAGIPSATDLSGNVLWTYLFPDRQPTSILYPIKLQTNGHFIALIAPQSPQPLNTPTTASMLNVIREFDLAGNTIRQLAMADLNTSLAAAGFNLKLELFSHDFAVLPNGHILVIANTLKAFTNLPGYPGTTNVLGDVVVDLDQNFKPVWVWNQFDHLDVNRHPYQFPDWTHSNAIAYSPDDGNFLISVRHQNWIIKVDYNNGAGAGDILWKLGYQGDFKLQGATDPTDWFYAQHDVNFVSSNTTGNFKIAIMDNGDDRVFPPGVTCGATGAPPCFYTTADVMQLDESAKTASFVFHQMLPTNLYSFFAGDTRVLANGNVEYNLAGVGKDSYIFEVTPTSTPQTVLQMHITADNTYRAFRIPSLYPGVQW